MLRGESYRVSHILLECNVRICDNFTRLETSHNDFPSNISLILVNCEHTERHQCYFEPSYWLDANWVSNLSNCELKVWVVGRYIISDQKLLYSKALVESCALNWGRIIFTIYKYLIDYALHWAYLDFCREFNYNLWVIWDENLVLGLERERNHCGFLDNRIARCCCDSHWTPFGRKSNSGFNLCNRISKLVFNLNDYWIGGAFVIVLL
jgi:hypothetical protein